MWVLGVGWVYEYGWGMFGVWGERVVSLNGKVGRSKRRV